MLKIAYCDDMEQDRNAIMTALTQIEEKWRDEFEIYSFTSGEELYDSVLKNHFDIVLLDIQMGGIDGIETATRIRTVAQDTLIIFISSYDDRVKELFSTRTVAFLDKPVQLEKLEKAMSEAKNIIRKDNEVYFSYSKDGTRLYLPLNEIVYFESRKNIIVIHTNKVDDSYYDTLLSTWQQLEGTGQFIMTHRSFIFNLKYVTITSDKVIVKDTGETFNIGRRHKEDTQERYLEYMEKRWKK